LLPKPADVESLAVFNDGSGVRILVTGEWLSRERVVRVAGLCALASLLSIALLLATSQGTLDYRGRPLGTDFSNVWAAGRMALDGAASKVWSWPDHFAVQRTLHHKPEVDIFGWHYPPPFLLLAAALALLPYVTALIAWQAATLAPFTWLMWRVVPRRETILLTLAAPVVLICAAHGHNGFLTALLLGGGLALLDERPFAAGLLFGCLIYKPQFALILPALLLAGGHWRAIASAALSAIILVAITLAIWGWPVWQAFADSLLLTQQVVIEQGSTGFHKIMSPFAAVRLWGGGIALAYQAQLAFTLAAVTSVCWVARRKDNPELRNALVCAAAVIATPYVLDYDLVVLLPALAWLWIDGQRRGFLSWEMSWGAVIWITPLIARNVAEWTLIPLGLISALALAAIALRRALRASPSRHSRAAFAQ
jgi:hypothetical protein